MAQSFEFLREIILTGIFVAKSKFKSVDEYIASQSEPAQALLQRLRATIRKALPGAERFQPL